MVITEDFFMLFFEIQFLLQCPHLYVGFVLSASLCHELVSEIKAQNNGQQVAGHDDRPNIF